MPPRTPNPAALAEVVDELVVSREPAEGEEVDRSEVRNVNVIARRFHRVAAGRLQGTRRQRLRSGRRRVCSGPIRKYCNIVPGVLTPVLAKHTKNSLTSSRPEWTACSGTSTTATH